MYDIGFQTLNPTRSQIKFDPHKPELILAWTIPIGIPGRRWDVLAPTAQTLYPKAVFFDSLMPRYQKQAEQGKGFPAAHPRGTCTAATRNSRAPGEPRHAKSPRHLCEHSFRPTTALTSRPTRTISTITTQESEASSLPLAKRLENTKTKRS